MAKGLDIGTMYVVSSQNTEQGTVFRKQRNAFYTMSREDFEDGFSCNSPMVIRKGTDVHIVGDDSVRYANLSGKSQKFKRPMAKGVLNPNEPDAIGVLHKLSIRTPDTTIFFNGYYQTTSTGAYWCAFIHNKIKSVFALVRIVTIRTLIKHICGTCFIG